MPVSYEKLEGRFGVLDELFDIHLHKSSELILRARYSALSNEPDIRNKVFDHLDQLASMSLIFSDSTIANVRCLKSELIEFRDNFADLNAQYADKINALSQKNSSLKSQVAQMEAERERRLQEHATYSPELRARVLALTDGKCAYCCIPISDADDGTEGFEVEHVVAKDNGGPDHFANYVPSCRPCNSKKRTSHVLEFIHFRLGIAHPEPLVSVSEETPVSIDVVTRSDEFLEAAE